MFFVDWETTPSTLLALNGLLLTISFALLFANYVFLLGGSIERLSTVIGRIRYEALERGSFLAETGRPVSTRHALRTISYMIFCAAVLLRPFLQQGISSFNLTAYPKEILVVFAVLIILILVLVFTLPLLLHYSGFGLRLIPGLAGVFTAISVFLLFTAQIPWLSVDKQLTGKDIAALEAARDYFQGHQNSREPIHADGTPATREEVMNVYSKIRLWAWVSWVGTFFLIVMGLCFFYGAIDCVLRGYPYLHQMLKRPECSWSEQAASGSLFRKTFRIIFCLVWLLIVVCLLWGATNLFYSTTYWFAHDRTFAESSTLNSLDVSFLFTCVAFGTDFQNSLVFSVVHFFWLIYIVVCWSLFVVSTTSFFVQRLTFARKVRAKTSSSTVNSTEELSGRINSLWLMHSSSVAPDCVVFDTPFPMARARSIGILFRRCVIEVTTGCLHSLKSDELDALLAHELAHYVAKHCMLDDTLRLFGRLTFFGDGFVRILEDTFGYELKADQLALELFDIRPDALKRCLLKLRSSKAAKHLMRLSGIAISSGSASKNREAGSLLLGQDLGYRGRIRLGLRLYFEQYVGIWHSGYWHPSLDFRIAILDQKNMASHKS
jgi:Zn-dependent protease with chaperone function